VDLEPTISPSRHRTERGNVGSNPAGRPLHQVDPALPHSILNSSQQTYGPAAFTSDSIYHGRLSQNGRRDEDEGEL